MRMIDADDAYKVLTDYYHQRTENQHKDGREKHLQKDVIEWLKEFPSAEHGTNLAEVGTDCISRQAAIDALQGRK